LLVIYSFLVLLAAIFFLPLSFLLDAAEPSLRGGWRERLGWVPLPASSSPRLWVHAVSVGEVQLARQLLTELLGRRPDLEVLMTSTTRAGRRLALQARLPRTRVAALPLDAPIFVARALRRARPAALILIETEIWPNLIRQCRLQGVPVLIANGRISPRAFPRYRRLGSLLAGTLGRVSRFLMRSSEDAERILALGAPAPCTEVTGNLKWDLAPPPREAASIRRELGLQEDAPVLVAGSTFQGEETMVLEAWSAASREFPDLGLVLAPRHPRRFGQVAAILDARRIGYARRSHPSPGTRRVVLLDTLGELRDLYAAGTVCFVGGSFVQRGGQNLMEPAAAGRPVLFGPRTENFADAAQALLEAGAGFRLATGAELSSTLVALLRDPGRCAEAGRRAGELVAAHRGATRRTSDRILACLRLQAF